LLVRDEGRQAEFEARHQRPIEETAAHWAAVFQFILSRVDEARQLMRELPDFR